MPELLERPLAAPSAPVRPSAPASDLAELFSSLWRHRYLAGQLVRREVESKYRGSAMGLAWALITPIIMLAVYTFVFGWVLKGAKAGVSLAEVSEFAVNLYAGLLVFTVYNEVVSRAPSLILSNRNYVKKVVFPLEILPWVSLGTALVNCLVSSAVLLAAYLLAFGLPHPAALLAPLILAPYCLFVLGMAYLLAALGVYVRDIEQGVGLFNAFMMFMSPIFYSVSNLPAYVQRWFELNPLTLPVEQFRAAVLHGQAPAFGALAAYAALSLVAARLGFAFFQETRKGFADVL